MHPFEDRLLIELRQVVAERPAPAGGTPARSSRAHRPRRRVLAATGALAATAAAVVAIAGGPASSPAYAVEPHGDGTVTVTISSLRDAPGLERALRAAGVPADVDYDASGAGAGSCALPGAPRQATTEGATDSHFEAGARVHTRGTPPEADAKHAVSGSIRHNADGSVTFSVDPGELGKHARLSITTTDDDVGSIGMSITGGPQTAPCPGQARP